MFRHEHDSDNKVPARPFHRRAQNYVPEAGWDGGSHHQRARRAAFTIVATGFYRIMLSLALLALVATGCIFALHTLDLTAQADTVPVEAVQASVTNEAPDQIAEIAALRTEVALLTEQSLEVGAELALLTGQGGVLPQLIARLQEQRRINAAHADALRQLYSTTGLIGASLPSTEHNTAAAEPNGTRPVQVTPVASAQEDAPKRVVLIPQGETDTQGIPGDGADE